MNICILIPVYNEARSIGSVVHAIVKKELDVVVVDDGSSDQSNNLASVNGAHVISLTGRHGKGYALKKGFAYILEKGYDAVIIMDGDGQHDPSDIEQFIRFPQLTTSCIVAGNRMRDTQKMPFIRYWTNRLMSWLISLSCRCPIPDTQCGFRLIGRDVLKVINLTCDGFEIETEILMKARKKSFPVFSVPVKTIYEDEKSKINPFKDTLRFIRYFFKEIFSS